MTNDKFAKRLAELRNEKGVSARRMSMDLGQNLSYINYIENGKTLPSMDSFFYICKYFNITPREFFNYGVKSPAKFQSILNELEKLDNEQIENIYSIIKGLTKNK